MPGVYSTSQTDAGQHISLSTPVTVSRAQVSRIAKAYRQSAQLFLTRRLPEAYTTIEPIISPTNTITNGYNDHSSNSGDYYDSEHHTNEYDEPGHLPAPIASASRTTRVKVWSFYLTFLNAVVELGPEEGKLAFGSTKWKALVNKARDGSVWEDVVVNGYGGDEGGVDGEVVVNLATLLLTHSSNQYLNQQRLETYLATSPLFYLTDETSPDHDSDSHLGGNSESKTNADTNSKSESESTRSSMNTSKNGTGMNVRTANTIHKILELYTLHVLPRNNEWEYAREFIRMSEVLDEERKQAFLIALHVLKEEEREGRERERWKGSDKGYEESRTSKRGTKIENGKKINRITNGNDVMVNVDREEQGRGEEDASNADRDDRSTISTATVTPASPTVKKGIPAVEEYRSQASHKGHSKGTADGSAKESSLGRRSTASEPKLTEESVQSPPSTSTPSPDQKQPPQHNTRPSSSQQAQHKPPGKQRQNQHQHQTRKTPPASTSTSTSATSSAPTSSNTNVPSILSNLLKSLFNQTSSQSQSTSPPSLFHSLAKRIFSLSPHTLLSSKSLLFLALSVLFTTAARLRSAAGGSGTVRAGTIGRRIDGAGTSIGSGAGSRALAAKVLRMLLLFWELVREKVRRTVGMGVRVSYV